jgi:hypothetical protein
MTPQQFERAGIRLFGKKHWKVKMARALSRHPSMIWRYATNQAPIPPIVETVVNSMLILCRKGETKWTK